MTSGKSDLMELTLAVDTPSGQVVVAGCSHPGIEKVLEAVRAEAIAAVIAALKAGARPTDVDEKSPFTAAYNRRKAREAGLEPRRKGDPTE